MTDHIRIEAEHPHDPTGDVLVVKDWLSYEVESDVFTAADGFTLRVAPSAFYLDFFREPGHNVRIYHGQHLIMTGIIEATPVNTGPQGPQIELGGRDYGSLLMDDSAPLLDVSNLNLSTIIDRLIAAHASEIAGVITSNDANRFGLVGKHADYSKVNAIRKRIKADKKAKKRRTSAQRAKDDADIKALAKTARGKARRTSIQLYEPYTADTSFKSSTQPGASIWTELSRMSKHIGVAAWMTADNFLCVSRPDYEQPPIGQLFVHMDKRGNTTDSNCLMNISPDIGNRYSDYLCLGQGRKSPTSQGVDLAGFTANARDPSRAFWWDNLQRRRQRIKTFTIRNTSDKKHLTRVARTMMEHNLVKGYNCTATVEGHEVYPGGPLWAVDTMVDVDYQPKAIKAPHWIRRRQFTFDGEDKSTDLTPMPPLWLAHDHDKITDSAYFEKMRAELQKYAL